MLKDFYEELDENNSMGNYTDLELFLEKEFFPHAIMVKIKKNSNGVFDYIPYIRIEDLSKLKLNKDEMQHALEYIISNDIRILSNNETDLIELDEYDFLKEYQESVLHERYLSNDEQEEEFALLRLTNDPEIRESLILNNLRIIPFMVWRYFSDVDYDKKDLMQYGYICLIDAVDNYKPCDKTNFLAYAKAYIYKNLSKYLQELGDYKYLSLKTIGKDIRDTELELGIKIRENPEFVKYVGEPGRIRMQLEKELNRKVSDKEIEKAMNKSDGYIKAYMRKISFILKESLDEKEDSTDEELWYDNTEDVYKDLLREKINEVLTTLTEKEVEILTLRFGLNGTGEPHTLKETAEIMGLTKERTRQIEALALRKLRHPSRSKKIYEYYTENDKRKY